MPLLVSDIPDWLQSFRPTPEAAIGFALIGLYYLVVWLAVGSDPEPGTIVVSYDPPRGLSPATLRYLRKKGFDLLPGTLASAFLLLYLAIQGPWERPDVVAFLVFFTSVWMLLCPILVLYLVHVWRGVPGQKGRPGISGQRAFSLTLFSLPFVLASIVSIVSLAFLAAPWFAALFLILFSLVFVMFSAMKAPTKAGRLLLDEIEGFRRFLIGVESDRLDRESRPERNSKLLERLLPYAFALDAHKEWARPFSDVAIADVGAQLEDAEQSSGSSGRCLDLSSFAVFVQRWYPFDLKDVKSPSALPQGIDAPILLRPDYCVAANLPPRGRMGHNHTPVSPERVTR